MRNTLNLNSDHNAAIRAEIAERLRVLLSKDQPRPPPRVQHLLYRLSTWDATGSQARIQRLSWLASFFQSGRLFI
jgi:hypothetical protein